MASLPIHREKWQGQDLNPGRLASALLLLSTDYAASYTIRFQVEILKVAKSKLQMDFPSQSKRERDGNYKLLQENTGVKNNNPSSLKPDMKP